MEIDSPYSKASASMTIPRRATNKALSSADEIVAAMREGGHSVGRGRLAVLDAVLAFDAPFGAQDLDAAVPSVHSATVYRSLALFEKLGVVEHLHLAHGAALYHRAPQGPSAFELVCEVCGDHFSVPATVFGAARRQLLSSYNFELDGRHFAIVGHCRNCAN